MKPKRVLIFSLFYYPHTVGGAEVAIKEITDRIDRQKVEFDMVTLRFDHSLPRRERIGNINVYRVGQSGRIGKFLMPLIGTWKTFLLLGTQRYDFFWSMMVTFSSGIPYIMNIMRGLLGKKKIPVILTLQEGDSEEYIKTKKYGLGGVVWRIIMSPFILFLPKHTRKLGLIGISWALALSRSAKVTAISQYLKDQAKAYGYKGQVSVIPNGVDLELFAQTFSDEQIKSFKVRFDKKEGDVFLITTSRLVVKNAIGDIISALTYLPANVKLLILGQGDEEDNLRALTVDLKVAERVKFLGYVAHAEMPSYLAIADVFVRPSLSEGLGNSFLEAMAAGLPVIGTRVGGIPDFLNDGETGLFCEVSNPKSIAQKVDKLLKDRESREYIVNKARKLVRQRYNWHEIAKDMEVLF